MPQPNEYLAIRAWGAMMRTAPTYVVAEQERAAETTAPLDSIYCVRGEWVTLSALTNPDARRRIEEQLEALRKESAR